MIFNTNYLYRAVDKTAKTAFAIKPGRIASTFSTPYFFANQGEFKTADYEEFMTYQVCDIKEQDYLELIEIWEKSVRATHALLPREEIEQLKPLIFDEYFDAVLLKTQMVKLLVSLVLLTIR